MAGAIGTPIAFIVALAFVLAWAVTGPLFGFSNTWQLIINTSTTVVTFLMVFSLACAVGGLGLGYLADRFGA